MGTSFVQCAEQIMGKGAASGRIHILEMKDKKKGNKLPEESHTPGRIYAIFRKDGKLVSSHYLTKALREILNKVRRFEK